MPCTKTIVDLELANETDLYFVAGFERGTGWYFCGCGDGQKGGRGGCKVLCEWKSFSIFIMLLILLHDNNNNSHLTQADPHSSVSSVSLLVCRSLQVRFLGPAPLTQEAVAQSQHD